MSQFLENAKRLDQLAEDYKLTALSVKAANGEAVEVMGSISTRIQQEEKRNEEYREKLKATIANKTGHSEVVRKMAGLELERLEGQTPTVTQAETTLFNEKINEANAALAELKKIEAQLSAARSDLKKQVDSDFKPSALSSLDALLLTRHVEGAQEEFDRRFRKQV